MHPNVWMKYVWVDLSTCYLQIHNVVSSVSSLFADTLQFRRFLYFSPDGVIISFWVICPCCAVSSLCYLRQQHKIFRNPRR